MSLKGLSKGHANLRNFPSDVQKNKLSPMLSTTSVLNPFWMGPIDFPDFGHKRVRVLDKASEIRTVGSGRWLSEDVWRVPFSSFDTLNKLGKNNHLPGRGLYLMAKSIKGAFIRSPLLKLQAISALRRMPRLKTPRHRMEPEVNNQN